MRIDLIVAGGYLSLAVLVLSRLWAHPRSGYLIKSDQDQTLYEWFFALTAHKITNFENPFSTSMQNFPDGVNLMANTLMYGFGIPLTPVTLLFGPTVTFALALTLGLSGTAFAWYLVFSRELVTSKFAAAVGGAFCGFAPAMISHTNGHPNYVVLVLLPFIAMRVIRMARRVNDAPEHGTAPRPRDSIALGLLVAMQIALGEEPLLLFALSFAVFGLAYLRTRRAIVATLRTIARPVLLAALITLTLTTIPLWWQFLGTQSYGFVGHGRVGNDLLTLFQFSSFSAGGTFSFGPDVSINPTEHNTYFGWPLLLLGAITAYFLRHERIVRAALTVIVVFIALSLGIVLFIGGFFTGVPMPWFVFGWIPPFNGMIESRFAMAAIPPIAIILTLGTQRAIDHRRTATTRWQPLAWFTALACALLPITPTMLPVVERTATPAFFTDGSVRRYISDGSVVIVPPPTPVDAVALRWQLDSDFTFPLVGGYYVGPGTDKSAHYGPVTRPTGNMLTLIRMFGTIPAIDQPARDQALADLRFWHADVVVLPPTTNTDALRSAIDQLLGFPAQQVDGVWLWDVRPLL
ncbi:glycosyl transferase [Nocardia sp. NPDC052001]|uniref:glycosyl transferase n=1 Tax=Nocardia sp. NPDC052001 TaxID=3154853 RepID=UPI00341A66C0